MPDHLPRIDKVIDLDPEEKVCCGQEMTHIGNDEREVLECVPAVFYVMRFLVRKYTCSICHGEQGCHGSVATADMPPRILPSFYVDRDHQAYFQHLTSIQDQLSQLVS